MSKHGTIQGMNTLRSYLDPIARLGTTKYSLVFPFAMSITLCVLSEVFANGIMHNPEIVGVYIIFLNVATIIYFSFRDGIRGGLISAIIPIIYYLYILYSRQYQDERLWSGMEATFSLGVVYLGLAITIGWLKQTIDRLIKIEKESRTRAEEDRATLQTIFQQLPVGIMMVDANGKHIKGNKHMEKILGRKYEGSLEQSGSYKSRYAYRSDKPIAQKNWPIVRALQKGETTTSEEMEYRREDKKRIYIRVNAAPIRNKQKQIIAAVSTFYDVTQEKDLETRKDDFVNMASHELKTPLTSMKLYIEILLLQLKQSPNENALKAIHRIKSQTDKLQELVSDLLDVSRLQTGKLQFSKETFDLAALVQETVDVLQETAPDHKFIVKKKGNILVYADRFRVYQVVTNLITNAVKYSPQDTKIIVSISTSMSRAIVSVEDFGIGIEKDQRKKVFDRLYQVHDPHTKAFSGLGMGLYISKEIIKRHRGKIWVEGEKGKGSTFFFTLPLKKTS